MVCNSWAMSLGDNDTVTVAQIGSGGEQHDQDQQHMTDCADVLADEDICRRRCPDMADNATLHLLMKASEMQETHGSY